MNFETFFDKFYYFSPSWKTSKINIDEDNCDDSDKRLSLDFFILFLLLIFFLFPCFLESFQPAKLLLYFRKGEIFGVFNAQGEKKQ